MTLSAGSRLGPYEILSPLGAGGMGEVHRARDTRLGREVAIKVLPERLSLSPELRERFEREARAIAALSHPHICAVYDVGREGETEYLVMELLEGQSLAERLVRGPLALGETLRFGAEIASALDAAHRKGIVHRDLKPGNVMVTASGLKLLDFGLAKVLAPEGPLESLTSAPTAAKDVTREGAILGTLSYMAPEQLEGKAADARTDIFALGVVLYEMATGQKAFSGPSPASLVSAILRAEPPPLSVAQPMSPPALDRVVRTCLAKDPSRRWQSAHDVGLQLEAIADGGAVSQSGAPATPRPSRARWLPWAIAAACATAAAAALISWPHALRSAAASTIRFSVPPPAGAQFLGWGGGSSLELSPDGERLAFVARESSALTADARRLEGRTRVWVRDLSSLEAHPVEGTDGASSIFWSPDGASIAFFTSERLARVALSGGSPVPICDVAFGVGRSGTWGAGGQILLAGPQGEAIYAVSADGGKPVPVVRSDPAHDLLRVFWPSFLPDGRSFLYVGWGKNAEEGTLVLAIPGKPPRTIGPIRSRAQFLEPGYIVFAREGALLAQRFDRTAGRLDGPPLSIAPAVNYFLSPGWAAFTVARSGALAYQSQEDVTRLSWYDRTGRRLGFVGSPGRYIDVAIAPDGKRILFSRARPGIWTWDVWLLDLGRGVETPVTSAVSSEFGPVWMPDGKSIVYSAGRASMPQLFLRQLSTGEEREVVPAGGFQRATAVSPDGRLLAFDENEPGQTLEARTVALEGGSGPSPFRRSPSPAVFLRFSPDGRVAAFLSRESGKREAYVGPFGSSGESVRVSTEGAELLRFSRDGKELFYLSPAGALVAVPIRTSPSVEPGEPRTLFRLGSSDRWQDFDVSSDGRFLAVVQEVSGNAQPATVVVNWTSELKKP
jgi:Tol biopolymer transport system component